jgi:hypothetical protein
VRSSRMELEHDGLQLRGGNVHNLGKVTIGASCAAWASSIRVVSKLGSPTRVAWEERLNHLRRKRGDEPVTADGVELGGKTLVVLAIRWHEEVRRATVSLVLRRMGIHVHANATVSRVAA